MKISSDIASPAPAAVEGANNPKLVQAAEQFESMLLQEMLKPMRTGQDSGGGEETSSDSSMNTISSFGTEAMAMAISKGGGLGIARQVIRQVELEHQQNTEKRQLGTKV
jgi:flagellar protein FlgJ